MTQGDHIHPISYIHIYVIHTCFAGLCEFAYILYDTHMLYTHTCNTPIYLTHTCLVGLREFTYILYNTHISYTHKYLARPMFYMQILCIFTYILYNTHISCEVHESHTYIVTVSHVYSLYTSYIIRVYLAGPMSHIQILCIFTYIVYNTHVSCEVHESHMYSVYVD